MSEPQNTHRMTIYLDHSISTIATDTSDPETLQAQMTQALDSYHRYWPFPWFRAKTLITIEGKPRIVIPIARVLCFKMDDLPTQKPNPTRYGG